MDKRQLALVGLIIASLFWGTSGVVSKILLTSFDPLPLGFLRFGFAALILFPIAWKNWKNEIKTHFMPLLTCGICSTANVTFFFYGLKLTTANAAGIIYTITPILVAIFSFFLIKERFNTQKIAGIITGLFGVLIIIGLPLIQTGGTTTGNIQGNFLIVLAVLCWTTYTIYSRSLIVEKNLHPVAISAVSFLTSSFLFAILTMLTPHRNIIQPLFIPSNFILVLHMAMIVSVATFVLYQIAVKYTSATTASLTMYIQPIFGMILNGIFLGEQLTVSFIFGSMLVFFGVFLTTNPTQHAKNWLNNRRNSGKKL